jgi:hypothetical protein
MFEGVLRAIKRFSLTSATPRTGGGKRDPDQTLIKRIGLAFVKSGSSGGRAQFETPDFDLAQITTAYDTDSYVKGAVDKYTDLIFKAGWELVGKNDQTKEYIRMRLALMAEATNTPLEEFLTQIAEDLVKYSNVFIVKARMGNGYQFPNLTVQPVGKNKPIVGYFVLPPTTIKVARDANGTVTKYQQQGDGISSSGGKSPEFNPQDMIHIAWKKPRGQAFGVPFLMPVLPDVRLLREIEENVDRLLHKYLHPLYKFHVGTTDDGFQSTPEEVEAVRALVEDMPTDGTLVLPERYDVDVVGAQGEAIDARWALDYFETRVFTGLGVPPTVFGRGDTANKSTADNLTSEMHDRVKAFQRVIAMYIDNFILKELLMEGGYDAVITPDDGVRFSFKEIAIDEQIKSENQAMQMYVQNAISFPEMRQRIGMDIEVDETQMFMNRVTIPIANATAAAKAEVSPPKTADNAVRPLNQHGKKTSPKRTSTSYIGDPLEEATPDIGVEIRVPGLTRHLNRKYEDLRADVMEAIRKSKDNSTLKKQIPMNFELAQKAMIAEFNKYAEEALDKGILEARANIGVTRQAKVRKSLALRIAMNDIEEDIKRLMSDLQKSAEKYMDKEDGVKLMASAFDVMKYRVAFNVRTRLMKVYNYGYALSAQSLGVNELEAIPSKGDCKECEQKSKIIIHLKGDIYGHLPPWHTNCWCKVKAK